MTVTEVAVGLVILVGLVGVLLPVLPGSVLILVGVLVWATETRGSTAWLVLAVATTILAVGAIAKYALPGRNLKGAGIPGRTQGTGVALGVVGFFVIPVLGLFLGFIAGVYLAERRRLGAHAAWPSTVASLRAVGLSILIELVAAVLAAVTWGVGVAMT